MDSTHRSTEARPLSPDLQVVGSLEGNRSAVLTPAALQFLGSLERRFRERRAALLRAREERQATFDAGAKPDFLQETRAIREAHWRVRSAPHDLQDRRVEITGPVDRKMVINALNSGARVYMADFEDSTSPTWGNLVDGQMNLIDAVRGRIRHTDGDSGKTYELNETTATLVVRPRGLHLDERHLLVDGSPMSGALFDAGLYLFHNAHALIAKNTGPYLYLPKLESHREARWWNDVLLEAQDLLGLPLGTVRVTVLIETLPAAFEMDEILFELREHIVGLNCGRWDYIFSFIKTLRGHASAVLPDRSQVGMDQPFLAAYSQLLIRTCHRRGAHAMGGMAAQIPVKGDAEADAAARQRVRNDKRREARNGHDGTWVAHPGLIAIALEEFDAVMPGQNQLHLDTEGEAITRDELLAVPSGTVTHAGLAQNLAVGVRYTAAWLSGRGCVPIDHLMEDAATAEISRAQVWQWRRHGAVIEGNGAVDEALIQRVLADEMKTLRTDIGDVAWTRGRFDEAARLFERLVLARDLHPFLTLPAYELL
mgnify:CR=1 FL=1